MNPLEFRAVCGGDEMEDESSYRMSSPLGNIGPVGPPEYAQLFLEMAHVNPVDGPCSPFMKVLNVDDIPDGPLPPCIMWVWAKAVTPTYLSFR